ncbi:hypothetical protein CFD26_103114 [Aspergillus turcosus]|uniref:Uncharacterized protein n=1 Tax=Aspergillus turcosus TaxID=1245748 RepID=A0A3R7IHY9_9EURO|nr:hypothetical protein CFD26_103114 [Aspergillus turcosus]
MVSRKRTSPLTRLTKSLIAMNGNSESSKDTQLLTDLEIKENARQSRRQKRRQARLGNIEATEESSDEARHINAGRRVPREPIDRLVAVIKFLGSYNNEVEQIEFALGDLLRKDERIQQLSATVQELRRSKNEEARMIEEEQGRLMELQSQLNDKETSLNRAQESLDEAGKQLREEKQRFQAEEAARYEKAIETEKKKLENELQRQVKQKEKATAAKLEQAAQHIRQLQHQVSDLTEAKDDAEMTLTLFKARTKELEDQQKELESRYKTQDSPLPEFEGDLSKIHQALKAIAHAYFGDLPPEDADIDQLQRILRDSDQIFQFVPLTASKASKYLRVRAAESVIAKVICHSLWQPFGGSIMSLSPDQISTFVQISKALARQDRRKESLWRYLTMYGLDIAALQHTSDNTVDDQHARLETQHLSDVLRVLVPLQKQKDFDRELGHLLTECVRFWNKAKRDSCIIEFDTEPPQSSNSDWLSEPCLELDHVEAGTEQRHNNVPAWCLFPRVTLLPINGEPKIVAGHAVFSDCSAFHEGLRELRRLVEELTEVKRKFARQPSI